MLPWRLAESLKKLREQINAAYPNRDKSSDGAIGDAAHASRKSDHNPWIWDAASNSYVVSAIDTDEDLTPDIHSLEKIINAICESRDPRVKYIIYEGRITVPGTQLQAWKRYDGKNPHNHHAHISVHSSKNLYDDRRPWSIGVAEAKKTFTEPVVVAAKPIVEQPKPVEPPPVDAMPTITDNQGNTWTAQPQPSEKPEEKGREGAGEAKAETVELRKERPSLFVRITAAVGIAVSAITSVGISIETIFIRSMDILQASRLAPLALGFAFGIFGMWLYDRSAGRSNKLNLQKIEKAADASSNTVELT